MFGKKDKPDLMVAFGVGGKKKPEEDDAEESGEYEAAGSDLKKVCGLFLDACGIKPKDPEKACDALKSFIEIVHAEGE